MHSRGLRPLMEFGHDETMTRARPPRLHRHWVLLGSSIGFLISSCYFGSERVPLGSDRDSAQSGSAGIAGLPSAAGGRAGATPAGGSAGDPGGSGGLAGAPPIAASGGNAGVGSGCRELVVEQVPLSAQPTSITPAGNVAYPIADNAVRVTLDLDAATNFAFRFRVPVDRGLLCGGDLLGYAFLMFSISTDDVAAQAGVLAFNQDVLESTWIDGSLFLPRGHSVVSFTSQAAGRTDAPFPCDADVPETDESGYFYLGDFCAPAR